MARRLRIKDWAVRRLPGRHFFVLFRFVVERRFCRGFERNGVFGVVFCGEVVVSCWLNRGS
jgi:hypothetical protein